MNERMHRPDRSSNQHEEEGSITAYGRSQYDSGESETLQDNHHGSGSSQEQLARDVEQMLTLPKKPNEAEQIEEATIEQLIWLDSDEEKIVVTSATENAFPGTTTTYAVARGKHLEPSSEFSYQWTIIYDPAAVKRENAQRLFDRVNEKMSFRETKSAHFEEKWDFPGTHTVEVNVYDRGEYRNTYRYPQTVQDAESLAQEAFDENAPPGMQPDVYLTWLQTQRQLAQEQGADEKQLKQIDGAIANATELLGVSEENRQGTAKPIKATLVPTADPQPVPLQLYLKQIVGGWAIVDLTNPDPGSSRTYEGTIRTSRQAERVAPENRDSLATTRAWLKFVRENPHPAGQIIANFPEDIAGSKHCKQEYSDGELTLGKVRNWFSSVGLVAGLGGLTLTVATGGVGTATVSLFLVAGGSGAIAGSANIADRLQYGNFQWDGETALDLVDIAGGLTAGSTAVLSLGGKAANIGKLRNAMLLGEAVETGSDVTGGVILGAQYLNTIEKIKNNPNLTPEQKEAAIAFELETAAVAGGLMVLDTVVGANNSRKVSGNNSADVDLDVPHTNTTANNVPNTTTPDTVTLTTEVEASTIQTTINDTPEIATPNTASETTTEVEANTNAPTSESTTPDLPNFTPNISSLVDALPSDLRGAVNITFDESLSGSTVRVYYQPIEIRVGNATAADIELHVPTIKTLQRYSGLTDKVRALIERITNWIKQNGEPTFGSAAWEAKQELEKLPRILAAKQAVLASNSTDAATKARIEADIADLESQIDYHAGKLNEMDTDPERSFIAAENTPNPRTAKEARELLSTQLITVRASLETRVADLDRGIYDLQARLDNLDVEFENRNAEFEARIKASEPELNNKDSDAAKNLIEEIRKEQDPLPKLKTQERELYRAINELKSYQSNLKGIQTDIEDDLNIIAKTANKIESEFDDPLVKLALYENEIEKIDVIQKTQAHSKVLDKSGDNSLKDANFEARAIAYGENSYEPIVSLPPQAHSRQKLFLHLADQKEYVLDSLGQKVPRKIFRNMTGADDKNLKKQGNMVATGASIKNDPLTHAMGTKPSTWISTIKAETIVNQGRPFESEEGKVEIDIIGIDPSKIVDLSTQKAQNNYDFAELSNELTPTAQATRDVVRTKEVLIKDKISGHLVKRIDSSK